MNQIESSPPELLTIPDVCKFLKCSPRTFREFARDYHIPVCGYHKRSHRYHLKDIMAAVERSKKAPEISADVQPPHEIIEQKAAAILRG